MNAGIPSKKEVNNESKINSESRVDRSNLSKSKGKLKVTTIRLPERHINLLTQHFENEGRSFSNGIRQVVDDFMKKNNIV